MYVCLGFTYKQWRSTNRHVYNLYAYVDDVAFKIYFYHFFFLKSIYEQYLLRLLPPIGLYQCTPPTICQKVISCKKDSGASLFVNFKFMLYRVSHKLCKGSSWKLTLTVLRYELLFYKFWISCMKYLTWVGRFSGTQYSKL